jgi:hypothetical protein
MISFLERLPSSHLVDLITFALMNIPVFTGDYYCTITGNGIAYLRLRLLSRLPNQITILLLLRHDTGVSVRGVSISVSIFPSTRPASKIPLRIDPAVISLPNRMPAADWFIWQTG